MYFNVSNDEDSIPSEFGVGKNYCVYFLDREPLFSNRKNKKVGEFKTVNFFIGSNNSGKSRFLRGLLKSSFYEAIEISSEKEISLINHKKELDEFYDKKVNTIGIETLVKSYKEKFKNYTSYRDLVISNNWSEWFRDIEKKLIAEVGMSGVKYDKKRMEFFEMVTNLVNEILSIQNIIPKQKVYIPILRSTHQNSALGDSHLRETIKSNYVIDEGDIYTGLEIYKEVDNLKKEEKNDRKKIKRFESFLSKCFFENQEVVITPHRSGVILVQVGEDEYPIHHVGDGIQALIILLLPVFTAENNTWFFIEEPETHLHPGFQRIFIETILNDDYIKSKNLKFFFTTHSNHFLDLTIDNNDISIFQFQKINSERFDIKNNIKPSKEILDKLGVQSSSVFLANTSIWVEGPTDRKYISKFLRLYTDNLDNISPLKEDIDYAFFEYGGNLITHYLFNEEIEYNTEEVKEIINSFALSNKICLVADNDNAKGESKKAQREKVLENLSDKSSNFLYLNTVYKEIENLLPLKIVNGFMQTLTKKESQKILFKREDYTNISLGKFYKDKFLENGIEEENLRAFYANSGTLKNDYKLKICDYFIQSDITYKELIQDNQELENIIEKLYSFIKDVK